MIDIRHAEESDVDQIREIFFATYGKDYAYPQFYDTNLLKRMVFAQDTILLVAEDTDTGKVVGTASVLLDSGALADLVGEFGRLAVHPDYRRRGIGTKLMQGRLDRVEDRLHVALVDARATHPFSQKIACTHGFAPVGFLPMKLLLTRREHIVMLARYFGDALSLRRNNPRIITEVHNVAQLALPNCGLDCDAIVDEHSAPYPYDEQFKIEEFSSQGYTTLLRFERGRVGRREIFGPVRLHYGLFKLRARHSSYLLARRRGHIVGAVGFTLDPVEKAIRIFELISRSDRPIRCLLSELLTRCREQWDVEYIEVDVSAYAPSMQRTLLEVGFLPAAYIPAMVFHEVERLDVIKMVQLLVPFDAGKLSLTEKTKSLQEAVIQGFAAREIIPRIAAAAMQTALFSDLSREQADRLAAACTLEVFQPGERIFVEKQANGKTYLVLDGEVEVSVGKPACCVGTVAAGECVGEMSLLAATPHSATATAKTEVEAAVLAHEDLTKLVRQRPDIGVIIYRTLATGLGEKLRRSDERLAEKKSKE